MKSLPAYLSFFVLLAISHQSFSQNEKSFSYRFTIKKNEGAVFVPVAGLDSIVITSEQGNWQKTYAALKNEGGEFSVGPLALGRYKASFFVKGESFPTIDITACSLCRNAERVFAYPRDIKIFDKVQISPGYLQGKSKLYAEIKKGLTADEIIRLETFGDKLTVKCFINFEGKISDILFEPASLPGQDRQVIERVLRSLPGWLPGVINGRESDDYIYIHIYLAFK